MNYTDFKNGDVIKIIDYTIGEESTTISIFNKIEEGANLGDRIYTYTDLDMGDEYLSVEKNCPNSYYIANNYGFELATEEEKNKLYESLFVLYTEEYDTKWDVYFTDSNYYEIEDFLFDVFCIKVREYDDDLLYPEFINDVVKYIWCKCCEIVGMTSGFEKETTVTMIPLEEIISEATKYFEPILKNHYSEEYSKELINGFINNITGTGINLNIKK
jgi:hypothetical protein